MKWISVNDRLPPIKVDILFYGILDFGNDRRPSIYFGRFDPSNENIYYHWRDPEGWNYVMVTHWMPLPPSPEI